MTPLELIVIPSARKLRLAPLAIAVPMLLLIVTDGLKVRLVPLAIAGVGLTLILVPLADLALAQTDVQNAGAASGVLNTFQQVGGAIGIAVISVLFFDAVGMNFSPEGLRGAFEVAIWAPLVSVALTGLSSLLLPSASVLTAPSKRAAKARR